MDTCVSPKLLHPGWCQKVNGAEWSSEVLFFSIHQHLVRPRQEFSCFSLPVWLTEWNPFLLLPQLLSRQVPRWMGHHRRGDWGDDTHTHTHIHESTHISSYSLRLENEAGFGERAAALSERLSLQYGDSCVDWAFTGGELCKNGPISPSVWLCHILTSPNSTLKQETFM